jgi:prepilin-type N-terminal cleavage/methylation domain-containing protein
MTGMKDCGGTKAQFRVRWKVIKADKFLYKMRGFTLLEILVSIVILAVILGALYGAYTSNVEAIQMARQHGQVNQIARIVLDRLSKELESAFIPTENVQEDIKLGISGENQRKDQKILGKINFTTLSSLFLSETGRKTDLCEVGYDVEEDPENGAYILYRREDDSLDADMETGGDRYEMARHIDGLEITFYDSKGEAWDRWDSISEKSHTNTLPSLVVVKLTLLDQLGRPHTFFTSVHPALAGVQKGR